MAQPSRQQRETAFKIAHIYNLTDMGKLELEKNIARALAAEREAAFGEAAVVADWSDAHSECGHGEGYRDGRADAAAAIRATIQSPKAA